MIPASPQSESHTKIDLSFVPSDDLIATDTYTTALTGNIDGWAKKPDGPVQNILRKRGFGWMLEVDSENDDFEKPLLDELDIDVKNIVQKMKAVLLPCMRSGLDPSSIRDNPDFWGPLVVIMLFSFVSLFGQLRVVSWILTIWLAGSFMVYFITRSLGGEVAYAQCLGIIGYCILPQFLMCLLGSLFGFFGLKKLTLIVAFIGTIWSAYSAGNLLSMENLQKRRVLVAYPVGLLYVYFLSLYTGV